MKAKKRFADWLTSLERTGEAVSLRAVLAAETEQIQKRRSAARVPRSQPPAPDASPTDLAGIALSGGGIRSATFCLGVLQALEERGVLRVFDYLSTVSGGGFVGGWWSAWLSRPDPESDDSSQTDGEPSQHATFPPAELIEWERETDYRTGATPDTTRGAGQGAEIPDARPTAPDPVHHLRLFSNYLTPRKGALSADTWRAAAVISRNLALTWIILLPLLVAVLALGQIYFLTTPAAAMGFVCAPAAGATPSPACTVAHGQLDSLRSPGAADSAEAVTARTAQVSRMDRLRFASTPLLILIGWLFITTVVWLLAGARDVPQLAGIVVGLAAALTLLHAVERRAAIPGR